MRGGPTVTAQHEYLLSKMGINSIADRRLLKKNDLLDSLNQPRSLKRIVALRGSDSESKFQTDEFYSLEQSKNKSFSYLSPMPTESVAQPLPRLTLPAAAAALTGSYNAPEAMIALRQLRKKNSVDFSRFWGWERRQRELTGGIEPIMSSNSSISSSNSNSNSNSNMGGKSVKGEETGLSKRVQAVRHMQAAYMVGAGGVGSTTGMGMGMNDSQMTDFDSRRVVGEVGVGGYSSSGKLTPFELPAPGPHVLTAPSSPGRSSDAASLTGNGNGNGNGNSAVMGVAASDSYKSRKPRIADLVLTDEHFDAVSKYFTSPTAKDGAGADTSAGMLERKVGGNTIYGADGFGNDTGISGQERGTMEVVRVKGQSSAPHAAFYVYSPTANANSNSISSAGGSPANGQGQGQGQSLEHENLSLDELLAFMSAVEGGI